MILLALLLAFTAEAKPKMTAPPPGPAQEFSLPLPASELDLRMQRREDEQDTSAFELAYSSWFPTEFSRPSYRSGNSGFVNGSYPWLSVSFLGPITGEHSNGAGLFYRLGFASTNLERPAGFSSQTLALHSLRLGAEYQAFRFANDSLQPFVGYSLLPTLALAGSSAAENNVSKAGLPMEALGGLLFRPGFLKNFGGMRNGTLGVAGHYIFGTIDNSKMDDLGVTAFLRVNL